MRKCTYFIKSLDKELSYSELLDYVDTLDVNEWSSLDDVVFSRASKVESIYNKLMSKNKEYHLERKVRSSILGIVDGEADVTDSNAFGLNEFLESDLCVIPSVNPLEPPKRLVTLKNDEDWKLNYVEKRVKKDHISEEDAIAEFDKLIENNDKLVEDSIALHALLNTHLVKSRDESASIDFITKFKEVQTDRLSGNTLLIDKLFNGIRKAYVLSKGRYPNSKEIIGLNLKSKLNNIAKDIVGHIDYLYIDLDGVLHLYNYKVSTLTYYEWPSAKKHKYKMLLLFLKYMLAENGVNVNKIDLNVIPVQVTYNDSFSKVTDIKVLESQCISTREETGTYNLEALERLVNYFLKDNYVPDHISNSVILDAIQDIRKIFVSLSIKEDGIGRTAEEWIKNAPDFDPYNIEPLVIEKVDLPNNAYNLYIRTKSGELKVIKIKSGRRINSNTEILNHVKEHLNELSDQKGYLLNLIKNAVKEGYSKGYKDVFSKVNGLPSVFLRSIFDKYLDYTEDEHGKKTFKWKLLEDLSEANILMFLNDKGQVDIISLSSFNLNVKPKLLKGGTVLGDYCYDVETDVFEGDFGNIELVKTMAFLNKIAPTLGSGFKLGTIQVINSTSRTLRAYSANYLNKNQFSKIIQKINSKTSGEGIKNNLYECSYIDEIGLLLDEYLNIIDNIPDLAKDYYVSLGFDVLSESDRSLYENALFNIISNIYSRSLELKNEKVAIEQARKNSNSKDTNLARLLLIATQAYLAIRNELVVHQTSLSTIDTLSFTALNVPDQNIRIITENLLIAHDTISKEFMDLFYGMDEKGKVSPEHSMNQVFDDFFKAIGYSEALNMSIGNEASLFSNLYELDEEGNNTMIFKNPYINLNNENYLTPAERILLKKVLFAINSITNKNNFNFTDIDSPALIEYTKTHKLYFWVPLKRASKATTRQKLKAIKASMKHSLKLVTNSKERFLDAVEGLLSEEAEILDEGFENFLLINVFATSMPLSTSLKFEDVLQSRRKMLKDKGPEFFETNLKSLFIDYLFKSISTEQYNKLLISTKALLLLLELTNEFGGNLETVQKEIEYIKDYLKVNVFSRSIMEDKSRKILSVIMPIKSKITDLLLMGNVGSAIRDSFLGVLENMTRSVIKMNTNITSKSLAKAYGYVTTHSTSNARAVNLLSKLCLRYRLSNTDVGRIAERAKTDRNGLMNWENAAYGTLRGPDFLNRMTLFVAKCMEDGCWDAWSLDDNGNLKYEWRKDKRFDRLAREDTSDMEKYREQLSLYLSKLNEYNIEHPDLTEKLDLSTDTDLPTPYSNKDILSIRSVADNIYGSYDKSKKSMYEHWAAGVAFGMFTTWFNGIYVNYFGKAGSYATNKLTYELDTDPVTGKPLYINPETSEITTNLFNADGTENIKLLKEIPILTQGIFPTVGTLYKILKNDGKDVMMEYLKANEGERANLRKLLSDLLMSALFLILFKGVLNGEYKEYKKTAHENTLILNLVVELTYKPASRAFDSFMGPLNIIQLLGDNMDPPYYSVPIKLLKDSYNTIFGEKTFNALMADNFGFIRSYSDTLKAERKKNN